MVIGTSKSLFKTVLISFSGDFVAFKILFNFLVDLPSLAKVFKEFTLIVLENMLYVILISSAEEAFGTLKNNGEITKIKNILNIKDLLSLKILKSLNNYLPQSIKLNTIKENNNLSDLIMYVEPLRNFLEILEKVPGYSIDIFLKRVPRLINEPYTKEMGIKIAKKVTEKGVVRLVKIAAGANI